MKLTLKLNFLDLRNTRVIIIIHELETYGADVEYYDHLLR